MAGVGQGMGAGQRGKEEKKGHQEKKVHSYQVEKKNHWLSGTTSGSNSSLCLFYSIYIAMS